ncbi:MAG: ABC transporter ATP-binding protein [Bacteroidetes bacterium]|nr:MAG: ABC transporter ATP-binding protein [Bacteroidota bacterium]
MLSIENLGVEFGGKWLFREATYQFLPGERIGLIGRNGAGKSTLLKILAEELSPSEGNVHKAGGYTVAYFNQDLLSYQSEQPIAEVAREAFAPLLALKAEIDGLLKKMEAGTAGEAEWNQLAAKQAEFENRGGNLIEAKLHSVLDGLGFRKEEHHKPYHTFSGGWRMRVLLAKMLLMQPNILMLDEPTNHLDLPSIQWLESYLKTFPGTCIVVSHDRFFIDRIAQKIIEITLRRLHVYGGNYSYYLKEKALRAEQHQRAYENQQKHIAEQERFINRFRYKASKARQVQSKIKMLEKLEKVEPPEEEHTSLKIRFEVKVTSGKEVLTLKNAHKAYGEKVILTQTSASVMRGNKIALIGANGLGKSTLLRILAGTEPFEGERKVGHNVIETFFAQHQLEALNLDNNILEEVSGISSNKTEGELRNVLGCFMFSGDEVEKKIRVLSGGEKSRVALAKTLLSEANLLLLDEPTNHLDIQSIQILVEALQAYQGTYVLVSHDRFFLEQVANKIWYIEDKKIKEYPGTYLEFERWKSAQESTEANNISQGSASIQESENENGKADYREQKRLKNRIKKLGSMQEELENQIEDLEAEKQLLELKMSQPEIASDYAQLKQVQQQLEAVDEHIASATARWEEVVMELEELQAGA